MLCLYVQIRVNAVNPTVVMTDMGRLGWSDPKKAGPMLSRIPLGRFAGTYRPGIYSVPSSQPPPLPLLMPAPWDIGGGRLELIVYMTYAILT